MKVEMEKIGQTLAVKVEGDLDLNTAPIFRQAIEDKLAQYNTIKNIMVDFSGIPFMDSSGLGVLLGRFRRITQLGGKMVLVGVKPQLMKMLELSGIFRIMSIFDNKEEGIKSLEGIQI